MSPLRKLRRHARPPVAIDLETLPLRGLTPTGRKPDRPEMQRLPLRSFQAQEAHALRMADVSRENLRRLGARPLGGGAMVDSFEVDIESFEAIRAELETHNVRWQALEWFRGRGRRLENDRRFVEFVASGGLSAEHFARHANITVEEARELLDRSAWIPKQPTAEPEAG